MVVLVVVVRLMDIRDVDFFRGLPRGTVFGVRPRFRLGATFRFFPFFGGDFLVEERVAGRLRLLLVCFCTVEIARCSNISSSRCFFRCFLTDRTLAFLEANFLRFRGGLRNCFW